MVNCSFFSPRLFQVDDGDRVRLNFSLDLDMTINFGEKSPLNLTEVAWRLINHQASTLVHENIPANTPLVWVTISFSKRYLTNLIPTLNQSEEKTLAELLDKSPQKFIFKEFSLDHNLNLMVTNLLSINLSESFYLSYAKAKTDELVCTALDQILQPPSKYPLAIKFGQRDEAAIKLAHKIILNNLAQVPSTREICTMIGMNRNKFYYGFKHLFKKSLNRYIKDERLTRAHSLITTTELSIIEIATEVGFAHQSSLSSAFKSEFGISPMQLRKSSEIK